MSLFPETLWTKGKHGKGVISRQILFRLFFLRIKPKDKVGLKEVTERRRIPLADVHLGPGVFADVHLGPGVFACIFRNPSRSPTIWSFQSFPELIGPYKLSEFHLKVFLSSLDFLNFIISRQKGFNKSD